MPKEEEKAKKCVLGVNFAAQIAHVVVVSHDLVPLLDAPLKIVPPENLGEWSRLDVFGKRIADEAKAIGAQRVAIAMPRKPAAVDTVRERGSGQWTQGGHQ
jgi:hypothetical protein